MYIIQAFACNISTKKYINAGNKKHAHFRNALSLYFHRQTTATAHQMNFLKLSKFLADHNRCIEWCKENYLLASSLKCLRAFTLRFSSFS